jgi:hypothetical protein
MRLTAMILLSVCVLAAGCKDSQTTAAQDKEKAQPRRMMKPDSGPPAPK